MAVGRRYIICQRRPRQRRPDRARADDMMRNAQLFGTALSVVQFLAVSLAVIERGKALQCPLGGKNMGKRNRVQPARADKIRSHV